MSIFSLWAPHVVKRWCVDREGAASPRCQPARTDITPCHFSAWLLLPPYRPPSPHQILYMQCYSHNSKGRGGSPERKWPEVSMLAAMHVRSGPGFMCSQALPWAAPPLPGNPSQGKSTRYRHILWGTLQPTAKDVRSHAPGSCAD